MSNATFSRKPLVAAVLTTLAVFSAGAMAGETEEAKTNVELTIGTAESTTDKTVAGTVQNEQTWNEAWAKKFDDKFTNASGTVTIGEGTDASHKTITIGKGTDDKTAGKLTNNLSSLTLNVGLNVAEGGTFVNNGTLEANKAITVTGSLVNTGTLKINNNLTINGLDKTTDLEAAPASVVMGDITLTNATLTNKDKGYKLKTEADKKEGEDDKTRVRVTYGKVTLNEGGNFVNNEGALDSGSSLTITKDAGTAQINGTSTWGTINAQKNDAVTVGNKGTLSADYLEYGMAATNATIGDLVKPLHRLMEHGDRDRAVGLARIVLHDNLRIGPGKALERRPEAGFGGEITACRRAARLPQGRAEARVDEGAGAPRRRIRLQHSDEHAAVPPERRIGRHPGVKERGA